MTVNELIVWLKAFKEDFDGDLPIKSWDITTTSYANVDSLRFNTDPLESFCEILFK